jgi:hypothetical protein
MNTLGKLLKTMSNDKQSMKLYTEEQVIRAIQMAAKHRYLFDSEENEIINLLTPIELPSDEDKDLFYQKQVTNPYSTEEYAYTAYEKGFMEGAKTVINKIQGGNK